MIPNTSVPSVARVSASHVNPLCSLTVFGSADAFTGRGDVAIFAFGALIATAVAVPVVARVPVVASLALVALALTDPRLGVAGTTGVVGMRGMGAFSSCCINIVAIGRR